MDEKMFCIESSDLLPIVFSEASVYSSASDNHPIITAYGKYGHFSQIQQKSNY